MRKNALQVGECCCQRLSAGDKWLRRVANDFFKPFDEGSSFCTSQPHGFSKLSKGPDAFAAILQAMGVPGPHLMA